MTLVSSRDEFRVGDMAQIYLAAADAAGANDAIAAPLEGLPGLKPHGPVAVSEGTCQCGDDARAAALATRGNITWVINNQVFTRPVTRYARSQRDQTVGQALGLLTTMPLFAFIGIAVTCVGFGSMMSLSVFLQPMAVDMGWSRTGIATAALITPTALRCSSSARPRARAPARDGATIDP